MRLAILNVSRGNLSGGYIKYLRRLIPLISFSDDVETVTLIVPDTLGKAINELSSAKIKISYYRPNIAAHVNRQQLSSCLSEARAEVLFIPSAHYVKIAKIPTVCMIQNMEPLTYNKFNPMIEKMVNHLRKITAWRAVKCSNRVIAVSDYVKETVIRDWHIDEQKIGVVNHGIDATKSSRNPTNLPSDLDNNFIFTAGSIRPARGLEDVIRALSIVNRKEKSREFHLLIAGAATSNMKNYFLSLKNLINKLDIGKNVTWLGHIDEHEMAWCYSNCAAFIMTSRVEACPYVALEAMAHGCNIISTLNRPMPDFFADAAHYYEAGAVEKLADIINRSVRQETRDTHVIRERAKMRASLFTWESSALKTLEQLRLAISDS